MEAQRSLMGLVRCSEKKKKKKQQGAEEHVEAATNNNKKLNFMLQGSLGPLYSVSYDFCNQFYDDAKQEIPLQRNQPMLDNYSEKHRFYVLGSCDGLLLVIACAYPGADYVIYIWNPTTSEYKILPQLIGTLGSSIPESSVLGFGLDPTSNNNYKVVHLESISGESKIMEFRVHLYTTQTNSWKTLLPNFPFFFSGGNPPVSMTLAYSNLHYVAEIDVGGPAEADIERESIISFDLKDDKFRELPCPITLSNPGMLIDLDALNDHLCALIRHPPTNVYYLMMMENFGVKEEEHWTMKFCINLNQVKMEYGFSFRSPLHILQDGSLLLVAVESCQRYIICYHTETKRVRILLKLSPTSYPIGYVESYISPNAASTDAEVAQHLKQRKTYMKR